MVTQTVQLPRGEWQFDDEDRLGRPGGFGEVFRGFGSVGPVAVKRLNFSAAQAAHRELEIGTWLIGRAFNHIVPIFDAGADLRSGRYFLIMPICERSLQEEISNVQGGVSSTQAYEAIRVVLSGLSEVPEIVHRDLKPDNVLLHESVWKIADFGIAKFVEESTSTETLREALSASYAAPEQWSGQRPTSATDIYALGCIAHALLSGTPPFSGSWDELREKHLHSPPPLIQNCSPRIAGFVSLMLRKAPGARPSLQRCIDVFGHEHLEYKSLPMGLQFLVKAGTEIAEREARAEAERQAAATRKMQRELLFAESTVDLMAIKDRLFGQVLAAVDGVAVDPNGILLGDAKLEFSKPVQIVPSDGWPQHAYDQLGWDILAWSRVKVSCNKTLRMKPNVTQTYTWSASLLYADCRNGLGFRWYEIAFWSLSTESKKPDEPFALRGNDEDLLLALGPVMHSIQVAYGPLTIDGEGEHDFANRWLALLSKAALGQLERPSHMPVSLNLMLSA